MAYQQTNLRRARLDADYVLISERLGPLREAIETLRAAEALRPDTAALLHSYEEHEARLAWERQTLERAIDDLRLEETEREMCEL